jgi:hypothetical protein
MPRARGQTTVEYVVVISVLVIAVFAATSLIWEEPNGAFSKGSAAFSAKVQAGAGAGYFSDDPAVRSDER